jgi:hypothetical protein
VPEKAKRQHNFVAIPKNAHGLTPIAPGAPEPVIWTAFEPAAKDTDAPKEPQHTAELLNKQLKHFGKNVVFPDENEFASAIVQSHRKGEVAFHVKAHRGSKDGETCHSASFCDCTNYGVQATYTSLVLAFYGHSRNHFFSSPIHQ